VTEPMNSLGRALKIGTLLALLVLPQGALAEEPAPSPQAAPAAQPATEEQPHAKSPDKEADADRLPPASITHHSMNLAGEALPYTAKAGTIPLRDDHGKALASIFYVAYMREPQDAKRPITFVFNGGPGAASAYLHLGGIGPKTDEVGEVEPAAFIVDEARRGAWSTTPSRLPISSGSISSRTGAWPRRCS